MKRMPETGFTLVELMIALLLTAMIMALLFGSLRITSRSWDSADLRQQQISEQYQLQQLLRRLIGQARAERVRDVEGVLQVSFRGEPDELVFVAPRYSGSPGEARLWYRLYLSEATDERPQALVLQTRAVVRDESIDWFSLFDEGGKIDDQGEEISPPKEHLLRLTGDARLHFRYIDYEIDEPERVTDQWLEETRLPSLVEVTLEEFDEPEADPDSAEAALLSSWAPLAIALQEYSYAVRSD